MPEMNSMSNFEPLHEKAGYSEGPGTIGWFHCQRIQKGTILNQFLTPADSKSVLIFTIGVDFRSHKSFEIRGFFLNCYAEKPTGELCWGYTIQKLRIEKLSKIARSIFFLLFFFSYSSWYMTLADVKFVKSFTFVQQLKWRKHGNESRRKFWKIHS